MREDGCMEASAVDNVVTLLCEEGENGLVVVVKILVRAEDVFGECTGGGWVKRRKESRFVLLSAIGRLVGPVSKVERREEEKVNGPPK